MKRIWLQFFVNNGKFKISIVEALTQAGVDIYELDPDVPSSPGIVFFSEVTQQLCNFIRDVSRSGHEWVLAVAISDCLPGTYAWHLLNAGAADLIVWKDLTRSIHEVVMKIERWNTIAQLVNSPLVRNNLVGESFVWKSLIRMIVEVARFTNANILIVGETGTGKELVARLIHALDTRPDKKNLVILDCTTIVPGLSGSEFFGHERGAFTGAVASRDGAFALANGGTLFLDEVGELHVDLQAQLLRVIEEHTYKRIGGNTWDKTNFRLVCATNKDLLQEVTQRRFRSDLYYRIASWICKMPPLRERIEDILLLTYHFIKQLWPHGDPPEIDEPVRQYLIKRHYPGNIRDLRQLVSRIIYRYVGSGSITVGCIPRDEHPLLESASEWYDESFYRSIYRALTLGMNLKEIRRIAEDTAIRIIVNEEKGNLQRAAHRLGITDRALQLRRAAKRRKLQSSNTK